MSGSHYLNPFSILTNKILCLFAILLLCATAAPVMACSIDSGWIPAGNGTTSAPRYQGECAYQAASVGDTLKHSMADVATYTVSFYVLTRFNNGSTASNEVTVFRASDDTNTQLELTIKGDKTAELTVTGAGTLSGDINVPTQNYNGWNHYKIIYDGNNVSFFINGQQAAGTQTLSGTLDEQQIGHIASSSPNLAASLAFDYFVSLLTDDTSLTKVLCPGDTNNTNTLNITDVLQAANDPLVDIIGQPDFDGNGGVNIGDALQINANQGNCS